MHIAALAAVAVLAQLPGARAIHACGAAGPYWPTMTLAVRGTTAWVACKEQSRLIHVSTSTGKTIGAVRLGGTPIAVVSGLDAVWALDSGGTLYRVDTVRAKVAKRWSLPVSAAYNLWIGGGSVWTADDRGGKVLRISPKGRIVARPSSFGDGPADMAFHGNDAWIVNHRDRVLAHVDLRTNKSRSLAVLPGDAPERMVWAQNALWLTGRGTDLLRVDPAAGQTLDTIEIGASGIDIAVQGDDLYVPTRSDAVDQSGFPTMEALKRVSASTLAVTTVSTPTDRFDVHGIVATGSTLWLADNTAGFLYAVPRR